MKTPDRLSAGLHGAVRTVASRIVTIEHDALEKLDHAQVDEYDDAGRLAVRTFHKADGTLWYRTTFAYDSHGRLCETRHDNADGTTFTRAISPDESAQPPVVVDDMEFQAEPGQRMAVFRDAAGNELEETCTRDNGRRNPQLLLPHLTLVDLPTRPT